MKRLVFAVDGDKAQEAQELTLPEAGLKERSDLQEWILRHPSIIGDDVLVVTSEFDRWTSGAGTTAKERLDVLGLDVSGRLVVVELKRDSDKLIHLQALTYAALVSGFDEETLTGVHADWLTKRGHLTTPDEARELLRNHTGGAELDPEVLAVPRIVLLAGSHPAQVLTTVVWLEQRSDQINIELREVHAWKVGDQITVTFDKIYPVEGVESVLLAPARKQAAEAVKKAEEQARSATAVKIITQNQLIEPGTTLTFQIPAEIPAAVRAQVEHWISEEPGRGQATWEPDPVRPLSWEGERYSPTKLALKILDDGAEYTRASVRGTEFWLTPEGESLASVAGIAGSAGTQDWTAFHELVSVIPSGHWTTYGDVGEVIGVHPRALGSHVSNCSSCPYGAHRILRAGGIPAAGFRWTDPEDKRTCQQVLSEEGLVFNELGHAAAERHLTADDLSQLVPEPTLT